MALDNARSILLLSRQPKRLIPIINISNGESEVEKWEIAQKSQLLQVHFRSKSVFGLEKKLEK